MGFFSWLTSDTNESIRNVYADCPHTEEHGPVYMLMPDGNHIQENAYEGYGEFGGVDAYAWLAIMNMDKYKGLDPYSEEAAANQVRSDGIGLFYDDHSRFIGDKLKYPLKFSFDPDADYDSLPAAKDCPDQGFFDWDDKYGIGLRN